MITAWVLAGSPSQPARLAPGRNNPAGLWWVGIVLRVTLIMMLSGARGPLDLGRGNARAPGYTRNPGGDSGAGRLDLFARGRKLKNVLYLHGFASSPRGR